MTTTVSGLTEATDPYVLSDDDAASVLVGAPWRRLAVVGDSLAAGTSDPAPGYEHLPWADRLARVLRRGEPDLAYLNTGVIGATTTKILATQTDSLTEFKPDLVHISSGGNDIWRPEVDFGRIEGELDELFGVASGLHAQITTFTLISTYEVASFPDFRNRIERLNDVVRSVAGRHGALVVECWNHPISRRGDIMSADHIHLNASGQAVIATEVVRGLAALLAGDR